MPTKKVRRLTPYNFEFQIGGPFNRAPTWEIRCLVFSKDEMIFAVEASGASIAECVELATIARRAVADALKENKQMLPDMGEWKVTYSTPELDKSH